MIRARSASVARGGSLTGKGAGSHAAGWCPSLRRKNLRNGCLWGADCPDYLPKQPKMTMENRTRPLLRRLFAGAIDLGIVAGYALLLFTLTRWFFAVETGALTPYRGQLIGFLTLTAPVVAYAYLTEGSRWKGTLGKRALGLQVRVAGAGRKKAILLRNLLKFLPWELAHTGVHWLLFYESVGKETPLWTWTALIVPQILVLGYAVSILASKGRSSLYDRMAGSSLQAANP
ncbi:RDD family protein [Cyclobacterium xiamenense]|uniref:RDD family protein n=1 Tax=Cyclobacterium xiamenense TaxID=1297121 RepID=UPI0035CF73A7